VASSYNWFSWSCSGYKTQEEAQKALDDIVLWFNKTHDAALWQVTSTVRQGPYGWKAELDSKLGETIG